MNEKPSLVLEMSLGELEALIQCVEYASLHAQSKNFIALQQKLKRVHPCFHMNTIGCVGVDEKSQY